MTIPTGANNYPDGLSNNDEHFDLPSVSDAAIRHNAYGWIRPDAETCYICGRREFITPVDGFQVCDCDVCERPVCQECAEMDYDGDSEGYRCTQWQCAGGCKS